MKKILFLVIYLLLTPLMVFANSGTPTITEYDAIVSNPNGSIIYDDFENQKINIPFETKITIYDEYIYNGVLIGRGSAKFDDKNLFGYIKLADVNKLDKEFSLEKAHKTENIMKIVIIEKNVHLYKGPSFKYEIVSEAIPQNTILEYNYTDTEEGSWIYTTYNGVSGWLFTYHHSYLHQYNVPSQAADVLDSYKIMIIKDNTIIYETPYESLKIVDSLAQGTTINAKYLYMTKQAQEHELEKNFWYYVDYNGKKGWIKANEVAYQNKDKFTYTTNNSWEYNMDDLLYKTPNDNSVTTKKLELNETYEYDYIYNRYFKTDCCGEYDKWYRVSIDNDYYWVHNSSDDYDEQEDEQENENEYEEKPEETQEESTRVEEETLSDTENHKISPTIIAILCISTAIIISLLMTILLILLKQKQNSNQNNL